MTKRDAVCEAALELFARKGIQATTTREIAERAGAAEGTLYRHFDGKDDLAAWLYDRCATQLHDRLTERAEAASTPAARLEALVRGVFDFFVDQPTACTYLLAARTESSVQEDEPLPPPTRLFTETIEDGMSEGSFRSASAPLVAGWMLAMVQRTVLFLKSGRLDMDRGEAVDRTVRAAHRLVQDKAPAAAS
jgi:AcrR family transcriptional regulator